MKSLNGIRGIAAICIAYIYHYKNHFGFRPMTDFPVVGGTLNWIYEYGWIFVELFFYISGFAMYLSYYDRIKSTDINFKQYFTKRIVRIFPLFWFTTIFVWAIQWYNIFTRGSSFIVQVNDLHHLLLNIFGIQCMDGLSSAQSFNAPGWFLTPLFACYIIFYGLSKKICKEDKFIYYCIIVVFGGVFIGRTGTFLMIPFLSASMGWAYAAFFMGVLFAYFVKKNSIPDKSSAKYTLLGFLLIGLWVMSYKYNLLGDFATTFIFILCTGVIFIAIYSNLMKRLLEIKILQFLGKISFSIYLWNFPTDAVFDLINSKFGIFDYSSIRFWCLHLLVSLLIACISNYLLEPFITQKVIKRLGVEYQ